MTDVNKIIDGLREKQRAYHPPYARGDFAVVPLADAEAAVHDAFAAARRAAATPDPQDMRPDSELTEEELAARRARAHAKIEQAKDAGVTESPLVKFARVWN